MTVCSDMESYERAQATVNVTTSRSGTLTVVACFHSNELGGVSGTMDINVIAPEHHDLHGSSQHVSL